MQRAPRPETATAMPGAARGPAAPRGGDPERRRPAPDRGSFYRPVITTFARLLPYARRYATGILAGLALVIVSNAAGVFSPWLLGEAIDALARPTVTAATLAGYA